MKVYAWKDRRTERVPRALVQRGACERNQCGQFAISISDGDIGLTVRFESAEEFERFIEQGEIIAGQAEREGQQMLPLGGLPKDQTSSA